MAVSRVGLNSFRMPDLSNSNQIGLAKKNLRKLSTALDSSSPLQLRRHQLEQLVEAAQNDNLFFQDLSAARKGITALCFDAEPSIQEAAKQLIDSVIEDPLLQQVARGETILILVDPAAIEKKDEASDVVPVIAEKLGASDASIKQKGDDILRHLAGPRSTPPPDVPRDVVLPEEIETPLKDLTTALEGIGKSIQTLAEQWQEIADTVRADRSILDEAEAKVIADLDGEIEDLSFKADLDRIEEKLHEAVQLAWGIKSMAGALKETKHVLTESVNEAPGSGIGPLDSYVKGSLRNVLFGGRFERVEDLFDTIDRDVDQFAQDLEASLVNLRAREENISESVKKLDQLITKRGVTKGGSLAVTRLKTIKAEALAKIEEVREQMQEVSGQRDKINEHIARAAELLHQNTVLAEQYFGQVDAFRNDFLTVKKAPEEAAESEPTPQPQPPTPQPPPPPAPPAPPPAPQPQPPTPQPPAAKGPGASAPPPPPPKAAKGPAGAKTLASGSGDGVLKSGAPEPKEPGETDKTQETPMPDMSENTTDEVDRADILNNPLEAPKALALANLLVEGSAERVEIERALADGDLDGLKLILDAEVWDSLTQDTRINQAFTDAYVEANPSE